MAIAKKAKRGFFFTLTMIVVVSFMLTSVGMWTRVVEVREAAQPQKLKTLSFSQVLDEMTDAKLTQFANMSIYYGLYKLSNFTADQSSGARWVPYVFGSDPNNRGTANINASVYDLFMNGNTTGNRAGGSAWSVPLAYNGNEMRYTLSYWNSSMAAAASQMGFNFTMGSVTGFELKQTDPWTVSFSFNTSARLTDNEGNFVTQRNLTANGSFKIDGFVDPMISYQTYMDTKPPATAVAQIPKRQIFRNMNWDTLAEIQPVNQTAPYGKGWVYGKMTATNPNVATALTVYSPANKYILVISGDPAPYAGIMNSFGGVVLLQARNKVLVRTADAGSESSRCDFVPVAPALPCFKITTSTCKANIQRQTNCVDCLGWTSITCDNVSIDRVVTGGDPACACTPATRTPQQLLDAWFLTHPGPPDNLYPFVNSNPIAVPYIQGSVVTSQASERHWDNSEGYILIDNQYGVDQTESEFTSEFASRDGTSNSYHKTWDIEKVRDMAISGLYVERTDSKAPSFFQRFLGSDALTVAYGPYGIETFVVGRWAGGDLDVATNAQMSRADRSFYFGSQGTKIKGMPGCINKEKCDNEDSADTTKISPIGYFRLDTDAGYTTGHLIDYGLKDIRCPKLGETGLARCDS